jgi:arsenate reductase-like glutaredoxin family protein
MQWLMDEPLLLVQPLTRWQQKVTIGYAESDWKAWMTQDKG